MTIEGVFFGSALFVFVFLFYCPPIRIFRHSFINSSICLLFIHSFIYLRIHKTVCLSIRA